MLNKLNKYNNPLLLILLSIALMYAFDNFETLVSIIILFLFSLIISLFQRKWKKFILSIGIFFLFFIGWIILGEISLMKSKLYHYEIGTQEYYRKEIKQSSNLEIPLEIDLIAKTDTIRYIGFEGEYDAKCLYTGPKKLITRMQKSLELNKEFVKNDSINFKRSDDFQKEKINFESFASGYTKTIDGRCIINIAFNKTKTQMYYSAFYY